MEGIHQIIQYIAADPRRFLVARTNHERRFTGPKPCEMFFDGSFPQFCSI
jgi:hypothetical protein